MLAQLEEIGAAGHKALIFSQFTTLLGIVRSRLDEAGVSYAYLDGKTRRRAKVVERFLELQRHKRQLAEDILAADKRGLGALEASDLDVLLG